MYHLDDINTITPKGKSLKEIITCYIREKNLNFIVARGQCLNLTQADLPPGDLEKYMSEFSACGFSKVSCPDLRPSAPFLAADVNEAAKTARVMFLIDLTCEAEHGSAGKFYSKIMGALASQFFAACPGIMGLYFPFELAETASGRGLSIEPAEGEAAEGGTWIRKLG